MRLIFATIFAALIAAGAANASSFVVLDSIPKANSPSVITLGDGGSIIAAAPPPFSGPHASIERFGERAGERKFIAVSPSVIAMVDAPQPVAFENVAAIGPTGRKRGRREALPMVIRGGIVGDAFVWSAPAGASGVETPRPQQQVSAPPGGDRRGPSPAPARPDEPEPQQLPKSALPPAAAPTGRME